MRLLLVLALAAGCYRSAAPPAPAPPPVRPVIEEARPAPARTYGPSRTASRSPMAEALVQLSQFADEMCACTDKPCADAVQQQMMTWSTELGERASDYDKPSDEEMAEATQTVQRLSGCMMTAMGHGALPPTP